MALKNSFLSRLFGMAPESKEAENLEKPPAAALEPQEESREEPHRPPAADPAELELTPEHALHRLWDLRMEQGGWLPAPKLRLAVPAGQSQPLTDEEVEKELPRLRLAVTTSANQRIAKALPKREEDPRPDMDAQPTVFLSRDHLTAWLLVYPPVGAGRELNRDLLDRALKENQVVFGIDEELLTRLPEDRDRYFHLFLAAKGCPPVHGRDGGVVDMFQRELVREVVVDEYDQVDYTALNLFQNVEEGETICQIIPSLAGTPGMTVLGREIPAKDGKPAAPPKGRNTELSEDGSRLVASRAGHVEFAGRTFQVKPVLEIPGDVDFSTGNINFLGDVHIKGDVTSGFNVRAMGNIIVDGLVEAATVEAGGDLVVAKGVVGNSQALILARRNVYAKYLENCRVHARENLQADCVINCSVYCNGVVEVRSGRGTIIGGRIRAAQAVSASVVGSKSERVTAIDLGGMPCEDFDRDALLQEMRELREEYERTECQPDSPTKTTRMSNLRMKMTVNQMKQEQFDKDLEVLLSSAGPNKENRRLTCGIAYPGTVLTIDDASLRLEYETRQCVATLMDGEIYLM